MVITAESASERILIIGLHVTSQVSRLPFIVSCTCRCCALCSAELHSSLLPHLSSFMYFVPSTIFAVACSYVVCLFKCRCLLQYVSLLSLFVVCMCYFMCTLCVYKGCFPCNMFGL